MSLSIEGARVTPDVSEFEEPPSLAKAAAPAGPSDFEKLLSSAGRSIDRGEAIMDGAARGAYHQMDAATLIALQAGIYRYSEAIDLTSKLVERVTSGARTILQAGH
jgi:hypothetical protein